MFVKSWKTKVCVRWCLSFTCLTDRSEKVKKSEMTENIFRKVASITWKKKLSYCHYFSRANIFCLLVMLEPLQPVWEKLEELPLPPLVTIGLMILFIIAIVLLIYFIYKFFGKYIAKACRKLFTPLIRAVLGPPKGKSVSFNVSFFVFIRNLQWVLQNDSGKKSHYALYTS